MRWIILGLALCASLQLSGQNAKLAQQYYGDGEYEKALTMYEQLAERNPGNEFFYGRFIECLVSLERYDQAERSLNTKIKDEPDNSRLYVTRGNLYEEQFMDDKARADFQRAIESLPRNKYAITRLANIFTVDSKYDLAIETYKQGAELLRDDNVFAYNLGELYRRAGESENMIRQYLNALNANPDRISSLQTIFQRYLSEAEYDELQKQLYGRIQEEPGATHYAMLLTWVFVQQKDYKSALRQVKALDRRMRGDGRRVYELAEIAANDKDYDTAIKAYEYIVDNKSEVSSFYLDAQREALRSRRLQLVEGYQYTEEDLKTLQKQYQAFLDEFSRNKNTASIILEYAELEALYLNDLPSAISLLQEMIEYPNLNPYLQAQAKLHLGDYYLMQEEVWEATLLYSQVDKTFKDDRLGHIARYKNARLSYYNGDFEWAQSQFDVLKASTSKLIANDALDLSVFIMDNMSMEDSVQAPLNLYAAADLLVFQNKFAAAFAKLDTLKSEFPSHDLQDDVLYLKAKLYQKQRDYQSAATMLAEIIEKHDDGIRADNAIFELAQLYEKHLNNKEEAMKLYEKLFIDYSDSTFAVEARKRFRTLRGDNI